MLYAFIVNAKMNPDELNANVSMIYIYILQIWICCTRVSKHNFSLAPLESSIGKKINSIQDVKIIEIARSITESFPRAGPGVKRIGLQLVCLFVGV